MAFAGSSHAPDSKEPFLVREGEVEVAIFPRCSLAAVAVSRKLAWRHLVDPSLTRMPPFVCTQAVALLSSPVDPRIVGYEKRLKEIENGLMGLSGRRALEMAQRASVLQAKIETLRRGGAALAGRMQLLARHDFRVQRPQWRGREGAEERGSFAARSHIAFTPTVPLDMTGRAKADGSTAASILAENLER